MAQVPAPLPFPPLNQPEPLPDGSQPPPPEPVPTNGNLLFGMSHTDKASALQPGPSPHGFISRDAAEQHDLNGRVYFHKLLFRHSLNDIGTGWVRPVVQEQLQPVAEEVVRTELGNIVRPILTGLEHVQTMLNELKTQMTEDMRYLKAAAHWNYHHVASMHNRSQHDGSHNPYLEVMTLDGRRPSLANLPPLLSKTSLINLTPQQSSAYVAFYGLGFERQPTHLERVDAIATTIGCSVNLRL